MVGVGFGLGYLSYPTGVFLPILPLTQQGCSFPFSLSLTLPWGGRRSAGLRIRPTYGGKFRMYKSSTPDVPPYPWDPWGFRRLAGAFAYRPPSAEFSMLAPTPRRVCVRAACLSWESSCSKPPPRRLRRSRRRTRGMRCSRACTRSSAPWPADNTSGDTSQEPHHPTPHPMTRSSCRPSYGQI